MDSGKFPIKGDSGGGHIPFWTGTYGSVEKSLDVSNSRMVATRLAGRFEWVLSGSRDGASDERISTEAGAIWYPILGI